MATYQQLFNLCKKKFNISWLYGQSHANEKLFLTEKAKQYPTLCVGFLNIIHPDRLHIIGPAEIEFFNQISHDARIGFLQKLVDNKSLGLVVCLDLALPDDKEICQKGRSRAFNPVGCSLNEINDVVGY